LSPAAQETDRAARSPEKLLPRTGTQHVELIAMIAFLQNRSMSTGSTWRTNPPVWRLSNSAAASTLRAPDKPGGFRRADDASRAVVPVSLPARYVSVREAVSARRTKPHVSLAGMRCGALQRRGTPRLDEMSYMLAEKCKSRRFLFSVGGTIVYTGDPSPGA